jgi:hypothetical protein
VRGWAAYVYSRANAAWLIQHLWWHYRYTMDEDVRVRWLRGPLGREMAALAGPIDTIVASDGERDTPVDGNDLLLQSLVQGKTNAEIAGDLGIDEHAVERRLGELFATIGASSRADATAFAFRERVL